jgi:flagellar biosynthesis protein FliQ
MGQQIESALRQSTHRVLEMLVSFLPGVLAFLLALIVFALIGWAVSALLHRILVAIRFDDRLERAGSDSPTGVADWSPSRSPALLVSRAALWLSILIGLAVGVSAFDASYAADSQVSSFLLPYLTHITGAVLLLIVGTLLARFLARSVLIGAVNAQLHYARFLSLG